MLELKSRGAGVTRRQIFFRTAFVLLLSAAASSTAVYADPVPGVSDGTNAAEGLRSTLTAQLRPCVPTTTTACPTRVPEPSSLSLLGLGLAAVVAASRKRTRS